MYKYFWPCTSPKILCLSLTLKWNKAHSLTLTSKCTKFDNDKSTILPICPSKGDNYVWASIGRRQLCMSQYCKVECLCTHSKGCICFCKCMGFSLYSLMRSIDEICLTTSGVEFACQDNVLCAKVWNPFGIHQWLADWFPIYTAMFTGLDWLCYSTIVDNQMVSTFAMHTM